MYAIIFAIAIIYYNQGHLSFLDGQTYAMLEENHKVSDLELAIPRRTRIPGTTIA